jgi:hypothetical protein
MSKTKKNSTKKSAPKAAEKKVERDTTALAQFFPAPKSRKPRMSADAARVEGAAKTKSALAKSKSAKTPKVAKERKPSVLDLAAKVLATAKEPLAAKAITERTIAAGWKTNGRTPHATLYAAIIREIAVKGKDARFKKTDRGLFTANAVGK